MAQAVLIIMNARGIRTTPEQKARVENTRDLDVLGRWVVRAAHATTAEQVLADDEEP